MALLNAISTLVSAAMLSLAGSGTAAPPAASTTSPQPTAAVWPLQPPRVVRELSLPDHVWTAGHRGVDLGGWVGAPVVASVAGTVTFAGPLAGRDVIVITQGDRRMTYEPVIPEVEVGTTVAAGTRIGTLDATQSHCFPLACLHWGWLRGEEYLDPLQLFGRTPPVRLLPLTPSDAPVDTRS